MTEIIGDAWQPRIRPANRAAVMRIGIHIRAAMRKAGVTATTAPQPPPLQQHWQGPSTTTSGANGIALSEQNLSARVRKDLPGANGAFNPGALPKHRLPLPDHATGALTGVSRHRT